MQWAIPFIASFLVALVWTPVVSRWSRQVGLVDRPDQHRKLHGREVPLGGGLAVLFSVLTVCLVGLFFLPNLIAGIQNERIELLALIIGAVLICAIGLLDDWIGIRGRQKLAGQVVACALVVCGGTVIEEIELFTYTFDLGIFAFPVTCAWLLAVVNAMNLIDGADGLASTVGIVISFCFAIMASMLGHPIESMIAMVLMGALCGFLIYNRPPARIFLGDAGSMLIGLLLGVLAIRSSLKGPATVAMGAAMAVWAVLFFDVLMAIARRKLTGRSLYTVDRGHVHHVLSHQGYSPAKTVLLIGFGCAICAGGALVSVAMKSEVWAMLCVLAVLGFSVGTKTFGFSECQLFVQRVISFVRSLFRGAPRLDESQPRGKALCSRFQGDRDWEQLWQSLTDYAERFDLCRVQMNISSPIIAEEYHAVWYSHENHRDNSCWEMEVPLFCETRRIGSLALVGRSIEGESNFHWLSDLVEGLRAFESQLHQIVEHEFSETETIVSHSPKKLADEVHVLAHHEQ